MKRIIVIFALACAGVWVQAEESAPAASPQKGSENLHFGFEATADPFANPPLFAHFTGGFSYTLGDFTAVADLEMANDGRYAPVAHSNYLLNMWARVLDGGVKYDGPIFSFMAGRFPHYDEVNSPYSLFINSTGQPTTLLDARFDDGGFFYETRWLLLNVRSANDYPDRGAVYKTFGARLGNWKFGYQDAAVFLRPGGFDFDYFLIPLPGFFVQVIDRINGSPWERKQNDNGIMGLFGQYNDGTFGAYVQLLVDDINLNRIFNPSGSMNPDKIAFALGASYRSEIGKFSAHAALSTKYTFESIAWDDSDAKYGYMYSPTSYYEFDGEQRALDPVDNMIGFKYGENTLSFMVNYNNVFRIFKIDTILEYVVNGARSMGNPWHQYSRNPHDSGFLDDPVLEHTIALSLKISNSIDVYTLSAGLTMGYRFNPSELAAVSSLPDYVSYPGTNDAPILVPTKGGRPILAFTFGLIISLPFTL